MLKILFLILKWFLIYFFVMGSLLTIFCCLYCYVDDKLTRKEYNIKTKGKITRVVKEKKITWVYYALENQALGDRCTSFGNVCYKVGDTVDILLNGENNKSIMVDELASNNYLIIVLGV